MKKSAKSNSSKIIIILLALLIGLVGGFVGVTYATLPDTEDLLVTSEVFYSYNNADEIVTAELTGMPSEVSVHFLELGNKYTGDCTYIKVGDVDILIDCGSKTNSISTVSNYLNQYVTDGKLEYVIVTHAHTDHYAGFATSEKVKSIFDLYECENIITFAKTNQTTGATYKNFLRELDDEVEAGASHYTADQCVDEPFVLNAEFNITLEILDSYYYYNSATSENDYSVCAMLNQGTDEDAKHFLFTGDLEADGETRLLDLNPELKEDGFYVDLYKAGHHGSKTSSSEEFLKAIKPKKVCVCCCAGSPEYTNTPENQFPTQEFIDRISLYTNEVYVTTLCIDYKNNEFTSFNGNIVIISNAEKFGVNCSNNNSILKDTDWFKNNRTTPNAWK